MAVTVNPTLAVWRDAGQTKLRQEGRCRMCERPSAERRLTRHHLVPRAWFAPRLAALSGDDWFQLWRLRDCDANIVPLCWPCHQAVERDGPPARRMLRKVLGAAEAAFAVAVRGQAWLDERYPASATDSQPRSHARR